MEGGLGYGTSEAAQYLIRVIILKISVLVEFDTAGYWQEQQVQFNATANSP